MYSISTTLDRNIYDSVDLTQWFYFAILTFFVLSKLTISFILLFLKATQKNPPSKIRPRSLDAQIINSDDYRFKCELMLY